MAEGYLLVNTIGAYSGMVLFSDRAGQHTPGVAIAADGTWTMTVSSICAARDFTDSTTGTGDDVVVYRCNAGVASITYDGGGNFNEIGSYSGSVPWRTGPSLVEITAGGGWSIAVE